MAAADFRGPSPDLMIADKGGLLTPGISLLRLPLKAVHCRAGSRSCQEDGASAMGREMARGNCCRRGGAGGAAARRI